MFNNFKIFNKNRVGTGGILFLFSSLFLAFMMISLVLFMKASTARSVGESVEHTIAMECLASCYLDPTGNGCSGENVTNFDSNKEFTALGASSNTIKPLEQFNSIMTSYHLMNSDSPATEMTLKYIKNDTHEGATTGNSTFEVQANSFGCFNSLWTKNISIICNPVKCTIEKTYKG